MARCSASSGDTASRAKKTAHAAEQDRPDILKRHWEWFENQPDLDPDRLVFIDETWAKTNMARTHGRAPRGERLRAAIPHGHWQTTTFVAGLRNSGMIAPMGLDGPINGELLEAYVEQVLIPDLRPGDIVVMDNLGSHKGAGVRAAINAAGAELLYLPPYSPDFNPIEKAFSSSRQCCEKPQLEQSVPSGPPSARSSAPSPQLNAPTTSSPLDTIQSDWIPL